MQTVFFKPTRIDEASLHRLNEVVSYLGEISDFQLMARLYQKIIFLLELEYYKKHFRLFIGINFKSYKFGPFNIEIAQALENPNPTKYSKEVKEQVDAILKVYKLDKEINNRTMMKAYKKMIDYIHSLVFYNLTPFGHDLIFENYQNEDIFATMKSNLDGKKLEEERSEFQRIRQEAKQYQCLFQT